MIFSHCHHSRNFAETFFLNNFLWSDSSEKSCKNFIKQGWKKSGKKIGLFSGAPRLKKKSGLKISLSKEWGAKKKEIQLFFSSFKTTLFSIGILNTWPRFFFLGFDPDPEFFWYFFHPCHKGYEKNQREWKDARKKMVLFLSCCLILSKEGLFEIIFSQLNEKLLFVNSLL